MEYVLLYLIVNVGVGAVACFLGKKLFYLMLGALVFLGVFNLVLNATDGSDASLVIAAAAGIVAALLSRFAYKAGVFLAGAVAGAALGFIGGMLAPAGADAYPGAIMAITALLAGLAALRWCDLFVRFGTAYAGATFMVSNALAALVSFGDLAALAVPGDALATFDALTGYIGGGFSAAYATPILIGTLACTVAGALVQKRQD